MSPPSSTSPNSGDKGTEIITIKNAAKVNTKKDSSLTDIALYEYSIVVDGSKNLKSITFTPDNLGNSDGYIMCVFAITGYNDGTNTTSYIVSVKSGNTVTGYTSLTDAINNAKDGDTITLNGDITNNNSIDNSDANGVTINKSITLDTNGHNINVNVTVDANNVSIKDTGDTKGTISSLTINSSKTGTSIEGATITTLTNNSGSAIKVKNTGTYSYEVEPEDTLNYKVTKDDTNNTWTISYKWDNLNTIEVDTSSKTYTSSDITTPATITISDLGNLTIKDSSGNTLTDGSSLSVSEYVDSIDTSDNTLNYSADLEDIDNLSIDASVKVKTKIKNEDGEALSTEAYYKSYATSAFEKIKALFTDDFYNNYTEANKTTIKNALSICETAIGNATSQGALNSALDALKNVLKETDKSNYYVKINLDGTNGSLNNNMFKTDGDGFANSYKVESEKGIFTNTSSYTSTTTSYSNNGIAVPYIYYSNSSNNNYVSLTRSSISQTVTLTDKDSNKYNKLYLIATAGDTNGSNGKGKPINLDVTINYEDSTSSTKGINMWDWNYSWATDNGTTDISSGLVGVDVTALQQTIYVKENGSISNDSKFTAYEYSIPVDNTKKITSIEFKINDSNLNTYTNDSYEVGIFALTGYYDETKATLVKAYVGGKGYTSLTEAIEAASKIEEGDKTIKLNSNITKDDNTKDNTEGGININVDGVTIDTNGYTIDESIKINVKANTTITDSKTDGSGKIDGTITVEKDKTLNLTGSVTTCDITVNEGASLNVKGDASVGNITGDGNVDIEGGKFTSEPSVSETFYTKEKHEEGGKTYWTVTKKSEVTISTKEDLVKALESTTVTKITLSSDISLDSDITITGNKTIDLNGKNITTNASINVGSSGDTTTNLTIKGSNGGSIIGTGSSDTIKVAGGNLNIESGTIKATGTSNKCISVDSNADSNTKVSITGGNFSSTGSNEIDNGSTSANVYITGGNFKHGFTSEGSNNTNKTALLKDSSGTSYTTKTTDNSEYPYTVTSLSSLVDDFKKDTTYSELFDESKTSVTKDDLSKIEAALAAYNKLGDNAKSQLSSEKTKLDDMLQAAKWADENSSIIADSTTVLLNASSEEVAKFKEAVSKAIKTYTGTEKTDGDTSTYLAPATGEEGSKVASNQQKYVSSQYKDLLAKDYALTYLNAYNTNMSTKVTIDNLTTLLGDGDGGIAHLENAYKNLASPNDGLNGKTPQNYLDGGPTKDKDGNDVASPIQTNLSNKKVAAQFLSTNKTSIEKINGSSSTLTASDISTLANAYAGSNKTLTDEAKAYLDETITTKLDKVVTANEFLTKYSSILDSKYKVTGTADENAKIAEAIEELGKITDETVKSLIGSDMSSKLQALKDASDWMKDSYGSIDAGKSETASKLSETDKTKITSAVTGYKGLSEAAKGYVSDSVVASTTEGQTTTLTSGKLKDMNAAVEFLNDNANALSNSNVEFNKDNIETTLEGLNTAKSTYEGLGTNSQKYVDGGKTGEGDKQTSPSLKVLEDKIAVATVLKNNKEILGKATDSIDPSTDEAKYRSLLEAYNDLTDNQKKLIDTNTLKTINEAKQAIEFIDKYTGKDNDGIIKKTTVTGDDYSKVSEALKDYEEVTKDNNLASKLLSSYKDDLEDKKTVSEFLNTYSYSKDEEGKDKGIIGKSPIGSVDSKGGNVDVSSDKTLIEEAKNKYDKLITNNTDGDKKSKYESLLGGSESATSISDELNKKKIIAEFLIKSSEDGLLPISQSFDITEEKISDLNDAYKKLAKDLYPDVEDTSSLTDEQKNTIKKYIGGDTYNLLSDPSGTKDSYELDEYKKEKLKELKEYAKDAGNTINGYENLGDDTSTYTGKLVESNDPDVSGTGEFDKLVDAIKNATSIDDVTNEYNKGTEAVDTVVSNAKEKADSNLSDKKVDAKNNESTGLAKTATEAKEAIEADTSLSEDEKTAYKKYIDYKLEEANKAIDKSTSTKDIDSIKDKLAKDITDTTTTTSKDKVTYIADVIDYKKDKDEVVDAMKGLSSETEGDTSKKDTQKNNLDKVISEAIDNINKANKEDLGTIKDNTKKALDTKVDEARKEARKNTTEGRNGSVTNVSDVDNNALKADIATAKDSLEDTMLKEADKQVIDKGTDVKVWVEVTQKQKGEETTKVDEKLEAMDKLLSSTQDMKLLNYLDITLYKKVGEGSESSVSETNEEVTISLTLSSDQINTDSSINRTYKVIRTHNNEVTVLDATFDGKDTITFKSDKFSTYALIYVDTKIERKSDTSSNKTAGTCEEVIGKNWTWSTKSKTCVYKVRNTSTN